MKLDSLVDQLINTVNTPETQRKLRTSVIDPLVIYFQQKLKMFYLIITVLLALIVALNVAIIYHLSVLPWVK